jgi:ATP-dependent DNA helicase RecG
MTLEELELLIQEGEGYNVEYKQSFPSKLSDLVEKVGSGIKRMRDAMKEANLVEPKFEMGGFFTVVFYRPMVFEKWLEGWSLHLKTPLVKILSAIYDEERITKPQLSDVIGQGKTSVDNNINKLKKLGLLTREGSDKIGRWVIHQLPQPKEE